MVVFAFQILLASNLFFLAVYFPILVLSFITNFLSMSAFSSLRIHFKGVKLWCAITILLREVCWSLCSSKILDSSFCYSLGITIIESMVLNSSLEGLSYKLLKLKLLVSFSNYKLSIYANFY